MCLGVPGQVMSVDGATAVVDFFGIRRETCLDVIDEAVGPGDYVLNHVGFAIRKIPRHEIAETLALYELLLREAGEDMMADDVRGEIEAVRETTEGSGTEAGPELTVDPATGAGAMMETDGGDGEAGGG